MKASPLAKCAACVCNARSLARSRGVGFCSSGYGKRYNLLEGTATPASSKALVSCPGIRS
eukprot:6203364-Pleurochrysis_carterae.AAC.6